MGARACENSLSYIAWMYVLNPLPVIAYSLLQRRAEFTSYLTQHWSKGVLGGVFSALAYAIVIWVMTFTQMAYVSALRETSVIFAAIIGSVFLGESFGKIRLISATLVAIGVLMLVI